MSVNGRLDRIAKQIAAYAGDDVPHELRELRAGMFEPSPEQQHEALAAILETMPEKYQRIVIADWEVCQVSPDEIECKPITARVEELAWLRLYQCPRPLAMPAEFCQAFERVEESGDRLRWDWWECADCLLAHPTVVHVPQYQGNFQRTYQMGFHNCVMCGGQVSVRKPPTQAPCHDSVGSPYRRAMYQYHPKWSDDSE